jgi:N-acetylglucosamine kinase-like BadF-type ATPase
MRYVIGVEGGGTKTNTALADEFGNIVGQSKSGPSNFLIVGFEKASENIIAGINECLTNTKISKNNIKSIMLGLTGAGRVLDQNNMKNAFKEYSEKQGFLFDQIIVDSDARISLEAVFPNKPGMIIIAGTGSIMFGKDAEGNIYRVGGWGRILGDEGSGLYIGKKGLTAAIRQIDGRGETTFIADLISERFNLNSLETIIKAIYTDNFDIASLAPLIFEAADKNDKIALTILDDAVDELFQHIKAMIKKIKFDNKIGISFIGSIITNDNYTKRKLIDRINSEFKELEIIVSESEPITGALVMALNAMNKSYEAIS